MCRRVSRRLPRLSALGSILNRGVAWVRITLHSQHTNTHKPNHKSVKGNTSHTSQSLHSPARATCNACRAHRTFTAMVEITFKSFTPIAAKMAVDIAKAQGARARSRATTRSVARSPCSTCASVRSLHAHTAPPSHTESIESAQVLSSMVPCWHSGSTQRLPLSLMTVIFPRAFPQSRAAADQYASLLSTPARFSLPRDCPILRPRAGLPLSSGGHATLRSR